MRGEGTVSDADAYSGSGPRTAGVVGGAQTTAVDDQNISNISKDTSRLFATLTQVLEKVNAILGAMPKGGSAQQPGQSDATSEGDVIMSAGG
jgi:hypothetical protein